MYFTAKSLSLSDYLKVSEKLSVLQVLQKLTEVTTDALFNLPALLTTQLWGKFAPSFLYSFEHVGKSSNRGSTFLNGLPIVANTKSGNQSAETVAHGDELAYLFDARDIFGQSIAASTTLNADDTKIREIFSNLIKQFVYSNDARTKKDDPKEAKNIFQSFKSDEGNFIRIGQTESTNEKDFR